MQMIKEKIRNSRGITLVSLAITITVLIIVINVVIYNLKDNLELGNLTEMHSDIDNLRDKIATFYTKNGKIPASVEYEYIDNLKSNGIISEAVDTGKFLVIDLSALDNLTLNKGKDYEKIKTFTSLSIRDAKEYTDLYIINETSHNIFYVAGITIDDETYYTDYTPEELDKVAVNLRYIEGIKIPDGFYYKEGTKDIGILISNKENTENYKWFPIDNEITQIPTEVEINIEESEDFIKSVNAYKGYYQSTNNNKVIYLELEKWSPTYDKEGIYKDKNGDTAYIPQGFQVSQIPGENTINEGLVVRDSKNNEWVWIEVPKSIYVTAQSNEDYENIEKDMQTYAKVYRADSHEDIFSSVEQRGFADENDYKKWKNSMLKSIYENGGFYCGRYEAGTETPRMSATDEITEVVIKKGAYPYNFVTVTKAQDLSKNIVEGGRTSSLMFGIQWDLILKNIEAKKEKTQKDLKENSATLGNYYDSTFDIIRGKYTTTPTNSNSWNTVSPNYTKGDFLGALLTTGATNRNSTLNIYDLAGNVDEHTLETNNSQESVIRGGNYSTYNGYSLPVFSRVTNNKATEMTGFRPVFW